MIYFKNLGKVYIQHGAYRLEKKYREGHVHVQGMENIVNDVDPENLKTLPEYFVNGWAQFMHPAPEPKSPNYEDMWDRGAYGVGIPVLEVNYVNIPKFKPVYLFYFHSTSAGNNETREVVQFDPAAFTEYTDENGTVYTAEKFVEKLSNTYWESEQEYYTWLNSIGALRGFNRNAKAYPPAVTKSAVSELASYKGKIMEYDGNGEGTYRDVTIHVTPMYIQNERPIFDMVYFSNDVLLTPEGENAERASLFPGRLLKWYGGFTSEWRHAINYEDHSEGGVAIATGSTPEGQSRPLLEDQIVIDGETYLGSEAYNVTKVRR
jgi:hypothetical protein